MKSHLYLYFYAFWYLHHNRKGVAQVEGQFLCSKGSTIANAHKVEAFCEACRKTFQHAIKQRSAEVLDRSLQWVSGIAQWA